MIETIAITTLVLTIVFLFGSIASRINLGQPPGEGYAPGWVFRCPRCDYTVDAGKAGFIRINARGTSRKYGSCQGCERDGWLVVEKTPANAVNKLEHKIIRCTECGHSKTAPEAGLVQLGHHMGNTFRGNCSDCGKTVRLEVVDNEAESPSAHAIAT